MRTKVYTITLLTLIYLFSNNSFSQKIIIDRTALPEVISAGVLPDVNNKVLIEGDLLKTVYSGTVTKDIMLFPGWPVSYYGNSERGGIWCNMDDDDDMEIIYNIQEKVYAFNIDGTVVSGWPQSLQLQPDGAPAFGDVDGDGEGEIVVSVATVGTGSQGKVYVFEKDGSLTYGDPFALAGGATKTPVLADLDGDGIMEIIVEERSYPEGFIGVYYGDGTPFPGFPFEMDYIPASSVAVGDITGDGIPEIVAESYYSVYAVDANGNLLDGFPFTPGNDRVFSYSSPVLADIDNDGYREILVGDHSLTAGNGAVHVLKNDGTQLSGWPKYTGNWIYGPPAVGDIDGDGNLDVAVGDQVLSGTPMSRVYIWNYQGNSLTGWPTQPIWSINNQIILADLDGDNEIELMWDDNTNAGVYIGYNSDGTVMDGWPLQVEGGSTFFMNPFVADVNNDGVTDISGGAIDIGGTDFCTLSLWDAGVDFNPGVNELSVLQYNVRHDGVYIDNSQLNANYTANPVHTCENAPVQFSDASTGNVVSWNWSFPGGDPENSTVQNPVVTYNTAGNYDVTLIVSDGADSDTLTKTDFIKVQYEPVVPEVPDGPAVINTSVSFVAYYTTTAPNADDYIWELSPDNVAMIFPTDTITKVKVMFVQSYSGTVELKVKSVNVCGESNFCEPLVISVNMTGVDMQHISDFTVSPNPASNVLNINCPDRYLQQEKVISIFNIYGRKIKELNFKGNIPEITIDIEDIQPGIYFVKINSGGEAAVLTKLIVK